MMLRILLLLICITNFSNSYAANLPSSGLDSNNVNNAINFAEKKKYQDAIIFAKKSRDNNLLKLIYWMQYNDKSSDSNFKQIIDFVRKNPSWPNKKILIKNAEEKINQTTNGKDIIDWFDSNPPITANGIKFYAYAKLRSADNNTDAVIALAKETWIKGNLSSKEEQEYLSKYGRFFNKYDHYARAQHLLWLKKTEDAKRMLPKLDNHQNHLVNTRINLIKKPSSISSYNYLKFIEHPEILYEMVKIYKNQGNDKIVKEILQKLPSYLAFPEKWWSLQNLYARKSLEDGQYSTAYNIAKRHNNEDPATYSDAEWLSGWLALEFIHKHELAEKHFHNMYKIVSSPISKSRAAYWLARTYEKMHKDNEKAHWYQITAKSPETFYGQLALIKLKRKHDFIHEHIKITDKDREYFNNNDLAKVAKLLVDGKKNHLAKVFLKAATKKSMTKGEAYLISEIGIKGRNTNLSLEAAKEGAKKGVVNLKAGYPIAKKAPQELKIELPLMHAIIRQESVFDQYAQSGAGAMGLMQLMPNTAKEMSKKLSVKYNKNALKSDSIYNMTLGSHKLASLLELYQGSYPLAIGAYNAGEGNVNKWISKFGDIRKKKNIDDIVNWIELVPFYETRNYIQRVLENLQMYRYVIADEDLRLDSDLKNSRI